MSNKIEDMAMGTFATIAISGVVIVAAYKYLKKYFSEEKIPDEIQRPKVIKSVETKEENVGFNLALISDLLTQFKISIDNNSAFDILLKRIQQQSTHSVINVLSQCTSPTELIKAFDSIEPKQYCVRSINNDSSSVRLSRQKIQDLISAEGLTSCTDDINKQIELLINLAYAKGVEGAKQLFNKKIIDLKRALENGNDASLLFSDIMDSIKFMS